MFTFIHSFKFYRFIKSGFLLDFIFKKVTIKLATLFFLVFNIFFVEKYLIEFCFFRVSLYTNKLRTYIDEISSQFSYASLSFFLLIMTIFYIFVVLLLVAFTFIYRYSYV